MLLPPNVYLIITYIKLPLPTLWHHDTRLWDRSPLHMLPYPTHAHPMTSARRLANSQPIPMITTSSKFMEEQAPQVTPTDVFMCGAPPSQRSYKKTRWEHKKKLNQPKIESGWRMLHASQCKKRCKSVMTSIQMDHPSSRNTMCRENSRKLGGTQNEVKTPNFEKIPKLKPIWPLGSKTPKTQTPSLKIGKTFIPDQPG